MENGKCAIAKNLKNGIGFGSTEFHVIRVGEDIYNKWVWHFLRFSKTREEAKKHFTGAVGHKRVPADFLKNLLTHLAPDPFLKQSLNYYQGFFSLILKVNFYNFLDKDIPVTLWAGKINSKNEIPTRNMVDNITFKTHFELNKDQIHNNHKLQNITDNTNKTNYSITQSLLDSNKISQDITVISDGRLPKSWQHCHKNAYGIACPISVSAQNTATNLVLTTNTLVNRYGRIRLKSKKEI